MKKMIYIMTFIVICIAMNSCSTDKDDKESETETVVTPETVVTAYSYSAIESETLRLINEHRLSIGLKALQINNHISYKCLEHNKYMVQKNEMNHDNFSSRSENIMRLLKAQKVGENVAHKYKTAADVLQGWLNSPGHKENIEGDYTHFGIAVTSDAAGDKYFTNIFAKI
jgi:uncharacterized protein YkwD